MELKNCKKLITNLDFHRQLRNYYNKYIGSGTNQYSLVKYNGKYIYYKNTISETDYNELDEYNVNYTEDSVTNMYKLNGNNLLELEVGSQTTSEVGNRTDMLTGNVQNGIDECVEELVDEPVDKSVQTINDDIEQINRFIENTIIADEIIKKGNLPDINIDLSKNETFAKIGKALHLLDLLAHHTIKEGVTESGLQVVDHVVENAVTHTTVVAGSSAAVKHATAVGAASATVGSILLTGGIILGVGLILIGISYIGKNKR